MTSRESTLIAELTWKLSSAMQRALAPIQTPKGLYEYATLCHRTYLAMVDSDRNQLAVYRFNQRCAKGGAPANRYPVPNASAVSSVSRTASVSGQSTPTTSPAAPRPVRNEAERLTTAEMDVLKRERRCFRCKEIGYHKGCDKPWGAMSAIPLLPAASARIVEIDGTENDQPLLNSQ